MKTRQILWNGITASAQVVIGGVLLFVLYRYLVRALGISAVGIWSLVLSTTSFATLANQGLANGVVKFVAKYAVLEDTFGVCATLQTAFVSVALAVGLLSIGLFPFASWALKLLLPLQDLHAGETILPWALFSLWINMLAMVSQAALTGLHRIDVCNYLEIAGSIAYLLLAVAFVPRSGLLGLAYAQALQGALQLTVLWLLLRRLLPSLPIFPYRWDRRLFREVSQYGLQFQAVTILQAVREPTTKALLTHFGGLSLTGYYDLAARWVVNFREILVQANQVLVPTIAHLRERNAGAIAAVYRDSYRLLFYLSLPTFAALIVLSPIVSRLWLGRLEPTFIAFVVFLSAGWLVNVLSNSCYVVGLGSGDLRGIVLGCTATALLTPILGFLAGRYWGGVYIVATSAFSLAAGYIGMLLFHHRRKKIGLRVLLPSDSLPLLLASLGSTSLFLLGFRLRWGGYLASTSSQWWPVPLVFTPLFAIAVLLWRHPLRKRLAQAIVSRAFVENT